MIGMNLSAFFNLLVFGFISSFVLHMLFRYRMLAGSDGFVCAWIAGWIGAWLGSPVFGHWSIRTGSVYMIPALLGAFVGSFLMVVIFRMLAGRVTVGRPDAMASQAGAASRLEMKKAS